MICQMYFMNARTGPVLGNGELPNLLLQERHHPICALLGNIPRNISQAKAYKCFEITQITQMLEYFKQNGVKQICIAGGVIKPKIGISLMHWKNFQLLWKIISLSNKGDNTLLTTILTYIESKGFEVLSATDLLPNLLTTQGTLTFYKPSASALKSINLGIKFLDDISRYDISQACVVENNCIIAIEGLEGTAKMISRIKDLSKGEAILVKMTKKGQTLKIDMPTIGIETIQQCIHARIKGIAIKAEETIVLNKEEVIHLANKHNMFISSLS